MTFNLWTFQTFHELFPNWQRLCTISLFATRNTVHTLSRWQAPCAQRALLTSTPAPWPFAASSPLWARVWTWSRSTLPVAEWWLCRNPPWLTSRRWGNAFCWGSPPRAFLSIWWDSLFHSRWGPHSLLRSPGDRAPGNWDRRSCSQLPYGENLEGHNYRAGIGAVASFIVAV